MWRKCPIPQGRNQTGLPVLGRSPPSRCFRSRISPAIRARNFSSRGSPAQSSTRSRGSARLWSSRAIRRPTISAARRSFGPPGARLAHATFWKAACSGARAASGSRPGSRRRKPERFCGPTDTTTRSKTFSISRIRSRSASSALSSPACSDQRLSEQAGRGSRTSTPTSFTYARSRMSPLICRATPRQRSRFWRRRSSSIRTTFPFTRSPPGATSSVSPGRVSTKHAATRP